MRGKRDWELTPKQQNIFENLWKQVDTKFDFRKNSSQGYRGKERYREGLRAFCKHLAKEYQSKNFKNISDKHLKSFVEVSKEAGIAPSTIKTDLASIRKMHDLTEGTRYKLSDENQMIGAEKRVTRGIDRTWRDSEYKSAVQLAKSMGRQDVQWSLRLARELGLRIEETTALTKSQLKQAVEKGYIHLTTTKGGIPRDVNMTHEAKRTAIEILDKTRQRVGERIFIGHGRTHSQAMYSISDWIRNHRDQFKELGPAEGKETERSYERELGITEQRKDLTFHGLRHTNARDMYQTLRADGYSPKEARQIVAEHLGHGRDDVTRIYLGFKN